MSKKIRVRFAPSPTGALHIGGAHTALFNWLWAKHNNGSFILRIEDTDIERSTKEYEKSIMDGLSWLGLDWDEGPDVGGNFGPYRQSERKEVYLKYAEELISNEKAYEKDGAIFFKIPEGKIIQFNDLVYGSISVISEKSSVNQDGTIKDIVIIKRDGMPTYNFAVVIDDFTMGINTVIRGEDHLINTPKQILIYNALNMDIPSFAHLPMILSKSKKKLSKRDGATSVFEYKDLGYLPNGVFNFLALLGWSPKNGQEIFTRKKAVEIFDISNVTKRPAVFDVDKLNHINQEQMRRTDFNVLLEAVLPFWTNLGLDTSKLSNEYLISALKTMGGRGQTSIELAEYSDYFISFEVVKTRYDASEITEEHKKLLKEFYKDLFGLSQWNAEQLLSFTKNWIEKNNITMKEVANPLRWALTGRKVSPGVFEVAAQLGRDESKKRLLHYDFID